MTFTDDLRERTRRRLGICPTCGQPTSPHYKETADSIGMSTSILWRFLRGHDLTGRNIDKIVTWLEREPDPGADDAIRREHDATHGEAEMCGADCIRLGLATFDEEGEEPG